MIRDAIKYTSPEPARIVYRRIRARLVKRRNARLELAAVFAGVYAGGEWGGGSGEFVSGSGSTDLQTSQYVKAVTAFIRDHGVRTLVDAGCGDFQVGKRILTSVNSQIDYVGIDIVRALIDRNQDLFGTKHVRFVCKDITRDKLPHGDLYLVRQVFQHLSNTEILDALANLRCHRPILISEHYPAPSFLRGINFDKTHGGDTRVIDGSGVFLNAAPFWVTGVKLFHEAEVMSPLVARGETIRTWLIE